MYVDRLNPISTRQGITFSIKLKNAENHTSQHGNLAETDFSPDFFRQKYKEPFLFSL